MKATIKSLMDLGGITERKEIKRDIYDNSPIIPKNYIDFIRTSKKTGNQYKPFLFQFNFAIKHLEYADFVNYPKRSVIEITKKGRKVDLENFTPDTDVRLLSQPIFNGNQRKINLKRLELLHLLKMKL